MTFRDYLRALRRHSIVIVAVILLGVAAGLAATLAQTPKYSSTSTVFVSTASASNLQDLTQASSFTQQVVHSYATVATQPIVLNKVIKKLSLSESASTLAQNVTATASLDTVLITITATDKSAARAALIANEVSRQLSSAVITLAPTTTSSSASIKITQTEPATTSATPVSPRPAINLAVGLLAGIVVALFAATILELLDTRVRSAADIEGVIQATILGAISFDPTASRTPLVTEAHQRTPRAEDYRALRTNLQFLNTDGPIRSIVVTSSIPGEGKSTSAANLAIAMSDAGMRVLAVDADLRRPQLSNYFQIDGSVGLTDHLIGAVTLQNATQRWRDSKLDVLPCGQIPPNPSELLQSRALEQFLLEARSSYDIVILDAPPLLPVTDAAILAKRTDGAIVACAVRKARRGQLSAALAILARIDARVLGILLTMTPLHGSDSYSAGYAYYSPLDKELPAELVVPVHL